MLLKAIKGILWTGLLLWLFSLTIPIRAAAAANPPISVIKAGTEQALQILRSSRSGQAPSVRQRRAEIMVIVDRYFNFHEMARRSLGRLWRDQPAEKQAEFVRLFKDMLFNTYIDKVESYTGSNEKFAYDKESIDGDYAVVKTRIQGYKNTDVKVDYRLRFENGEWQVYDVIVEGISLVDNYRSQFASILGNESFDGLLRRMRQKVNEMGRS
ncbi:MlaC/ttg2D family ABC transporter substrate-binding protein [Syntrophobacter fumaroxidans]|uniref:Toluene tolerance family protein n=1 Tax=Syntrophobacter fumaroxidans (strain DSM 10017 / MPOB) TaxID=335543 RepID=A0LNF5_SYNFM|nr:ABC transporter substrate-binding protein [Syntrophobacter fumaroxidans]ABK18957.1 toluene tolerance family protein [Syntrophobacter fumaroxidans MPOB]